MRRLNRKYGKGWFQANRDTFCFISEDNLKAKWTNRQHLKAAKQNGDFRGFWIIILILYIWVLWGISVIFRRFAKPQNVKGWRTIHWKRATKARFNTW